MASLKKQVSFWRGEFKGQVAWMAVWKEGRGWGVTPLYPDFIEDTKRFNWEDQDDHDIIRDILKTDPNAVLMNGYYCNLGDVETDTLDDTVNAVRRQYEKPCYPLANCDVAEWLNDTAEAANETEDQTDNTAKEETWDGVKFVIGRKGLMWYALPATGYNARRALAEGGKAVLAVLDTSSKRGFLYELADLVGMGWEILFLILLQYGIRYQQLKEVI